MGIIEQDGQRKVWLKISAKRCVVEIPQKGDTANIECRNGIGNLLLLTLTREPKEYEGAPYFEWQFKFIEPDEDVLYILSINEDSSVFQKFTLKILGIDNPGKIMFRAYANKNGYAAIYMENDGVKVSEPFPFIQGKGFEGVPSVDKVTVGNKIVYDSSKLNAFLKNALDDYTSNVLGQKVAEKSSSVDAITTARDFVSALSKSDFEQKSEGILKNLASALDDMERIIIAGLFETKFDIEVNFDNFTFGPKEDDGLPF